jgi:SAM-dependent methyltransferase
MSVPHPAKFTDAIINELHKIVATEFIKQGYRELSILDPMAGVGTIHDLGVAYVNTVGVELESEWAEQDPRTQQGDATDLPFPARTFDAVITSPAYGNRMADHHNAKDGSSRITYKHKLGRDLSPNNGGGLQWGQTYRDLHKRILAEMIRVCRPGGLVVVNISNHIRKHEEQPVSEWWLATMILSGLQLENAIAVSTPRMRFGENSEARVENEWVFVTRKGES